MRRITLAATVIALSACAGTPRLSDTMNEADRQLLEAAHWIAYHGGLSQKVVWVGVTTGLSGTVRSLSAYCDPVSGQQCRKVIEHIQSPDGRHEAHIGRDCKQEDGSLILTIDAVAPVVE